MPDAEHLPRRISCGAISSLGASTAADVCVGRRVGVAGVAAAVAFAYFTFSILVGPESYGVLPFLASTIPLVIPILNDRAKAQQLSALERDMSPEVRAVTAPTTLAAWYAVIGYYVGLFLAVFWFIVRYANAA